MLRRTVSRLVLAMLSVGLVGVWGCGEDSSGPAGPSSLPLSVRVVFPDEPTSVARPVNQAAGLATSYAIRGMSARAFSLADELPVLEDETSIEIAPSDTRFRLELSVRPDGPMAYYQVDVDASGTRETDGVVSESGLLFTGTGYGMVEDEASEAYVEVFLEDIVPLVTTQELSDGALVSWNRVSQAESYRVREVRSGGTSDSLITALSLFIPFDPGLESRSYRVQSVLGDGRASAFSEERSVGLDAGFGQLELTVVDARTSLALAGASVQLGDASTSTNEAGFARLDGLPTGVQTLNVSLEGYLSASRNVTITAGSTTPVTVALSPPAVGGYRVVLTWGELPFDLDAHLRTPLIDGVSYEVYYGFLGSETEAPFAQLDADDTESFGPETVTIAQSLEGTYSYFVYNYSQDPAIAGSGAQVELYKDNERLLTVTVPEEGEGLYWHVFDLDAVAGTFELVNLIDNLPGRPETGSGVAAPLGRDGK